MLWKLWVVSKRWTERQQQICVSKNPVLWIQSYYKQFTSLFSSEQFRKCWNSDFFCMQLSKLTIIQILIFFISFPSVIQKSLNRMKTNVKREYRSKKTHQTILNKKINSNFRRSCDLVAKIYSNICTWFAINRISNSQSPVKMVLMRYVLAANTRHIKNYVESKRHTIEFKRAKTNFIQLNSKTTHTT